MEGKNIVFRFFSSSSSAIARTCILYEYVMYALLCGRKFDLRGRPN